MNINGFMNNGIQNMVKTAGRYYMGRPKGIGFLAKMALEIKCSAKKREQNEKIGLHVPPFIIASITSSCNLHCAGCYARASGACSEQPVQKELSVAEWGNVMEEASALGVSFMLLAGGEPMMRRDVIERAAKQKNMIFPIFTNGSLVDDAYLALFDANRNLIPVFSIEGDAGVTDKRRGTGAYAIVQDAMGQMQQKNMLFGTSITVTKENLKAVTADAFVEQLGEKGCGLLFFVEYVPVEENTAHLALGEADIRTMETQVAILKEKFDKMMIVSFPGDEEKMGGCLASGRGFFHINPNGGAEPCPFSPYAQMNVRDRSIKEVLQSAYFEKLRNIAALAGRDGGCTLFREESKVKMAFGGN